VKANHINHEFIILDVSGSMKRHHANVIKVTDALISNLASQAPNFPDQETRITVFMFSSESYLDGTYFKCLIWDKDVLRVPSIAGLYQGTGNTALADAMISSIRDMRKIPTMYGDHAFLGFVVTDGQENHSHPDSIRNLPSVLSTLPDTWTIAGLVPSVAARQQLTRFGFAPGNVEIWDPSQREGFLEVGEKIAAASTSYASLRRVGVRSTTSLFTMNAPSKATLTQSLTQMTPGSYFFEEVTEERLAQIQNGRIDQFLSLVTGKPYLPGSPIVFYQMTQRVRIQEYKRIAVAVPDHASKSVAVYTGAAARQMLGLPEKGNVRVSPGRWRGYKVFVETTSMNRKLFPGTSVLIMR